MKKWQLQLGFWGSFFWVFLLCNTNFINKNFENIMYKKPYEYYLSGYILGYITVFSGHVFWDIINNKIRVFDGDETLLFRIVMSVPLAIIFIIGLLQTCSSIFIAHPWQFYISVFFSGIIVNQGVIPIIKYIDQK